jgi:hypothetical protein
VPALGSNYMSETLSQEPEPVELSRSRFQTPPHLRDDPMPEGTAISDGESPSATDRPEPSDQPSRPSRLSGGEAPSRADVAAVFAGALLLGAAFISWGLKARRKRLRQPSAAERMAVARPLASIFQRHLDIAAAGPILSDIADGCAAAAGVMVYLETNPVQSAVERPAPAPEPEPAPEPDLETAYNAMHGFGDEAP